jgi:hypothetical protein
MAKSRNRKDHKKKVENRNKRIESEYKRATKKAWETFEKMKEEKAQADKDDFKFPDFK